MFQAKLFKNGNSVVLALPEELRHRLNWNAGDTIQIKDITWEIAPEFPLVALFKQSPHPKETQPHARKTLNIPRRPGFHS